MTPNCLRRIAFAGLAILASLPAAANIIDITTNTDWSAIATGSGPGGQPSTADTINVNNATLTVDVTNGQVGALTLGGAAGNGTVVFSAGTSQATIAGNLTLGTAGKQTGILNMANGGTLSLAGFTQLNAGAFTRGTGTIVLTGTNTLPTSGNYATYNNLSVSANTTSLGQNTTVAGNLDVSGGVLNTATRTLTVSGTANIDGTLTLTNTTTISGTTTIGGTLNITSATGVKTFTGAVTINGTWNNTVAGNVFIGNNLTSNGTFTAGTGTYTFNGAAAQVLTGSAGTTSLATVVLNNANGLTLASHNLTVTTLLTLSAGKITTGANVVYVSNGSAISAGAGRFIEGNLKKPIPTGATVAESFEVGGNAGANYSPVNLTFASVSVAGEVTVSTTSGSHPQLASSGLDTTTPAKLNRWWSITNAGVAFTTYSAAFTYAATENDAGANATAFAATRYDGADWNPTSLSGAPTTTSLSITSETGFGDFAMGEVLEYNVNRGTAGRFNAYDPPPVTPTNSIQGFIRTKTAGTAFTLRIVHLNAGGTALQNVNKDSIRVELVDASNTGGTYTNNCSNAWTVIAAVNTAFPSNTDQLDVTFSAALVANSYPSVRVKVTRTSGGTDTGCSGDRFAIKPNDLVVSATDTDWQTAGTTRTLNNSAASGGVVHAASTSSASTPRPFTLRAQARNAATPTPGTTGNYAGSPTIVATFPTCALPSPCTIGTLTFGAWSGTGTVSADAHYSEVGAFNLQLEDRAFANVDVVDTPLATRVISSAAAAVIGRFVPDHFDVTANTPPVFQTFGVPDSSCAIPTTGSTRSFTYVGQPFGYVIKPQVTIVPKNAGGTTVANYLATANLWKVGAITGSSLSQSKDCTTNPNVCIFTTSWVNGTSNSRVIETYTYGLTPASTPNWNDSLAANSAATVNTGSGLITFATSDTLAFLRSTSAPQAAFAANITNTITVEDNNESGASITTLNPATFTNITFDAGNEFRFGRLHMTNAYGSQNVALPVGLETQYWNGSAFQLNSVDNCTTLSRDTITLGSYGPNLDPCETAITQSSVTFTEGTGRLYLIAPTTTALGSAVPAASTIAAVAGSVLLTPNLGSTASGNYCASVGAAPAAAQPANKAYLRGAWTGASYTEDPSARATFGFYGAQPRNFIYFRENY